MDQFLAMYTTVLPMIQFEFVLSFCTGLSAFAIGLATWLGVLEGLLLKRGRGRNGNLYQLYGAVARRAELHREHQLGFQGKVDGVGHV